MREIVTFVIPEFVNVIVFALLSPTVTFPKVKLSGLAFNVAAEAALVRRLMVASSTVTMKIRVNLFFLHTGLGKRKRRSVRCDRWKFGPGTFMRPSLGTGLHGDLLAWGTKRKTGGLPVLRAIGTWTEYRGFGRKKPEP
jgi:hypothetical protein